MFSEASAGTFVFRERETPSCASTCAKMEFHVVVFFIGEHQSSYVTSTMCVKASFLDDNLEQQAKYEWFSALVTVRTRKARTNQVAYCFWCALPLRTHRHMYHYRSAPSCIHLQMHVKGSVRLFSRHRETIAKISQESLVMPLFVRCTVCYSVLVLRMSGSAAADAHKSWPS